MTGEKGQGTGDKGQVGVPKNPAEREALAFVGRSYKAFHEGWAAHEAGRSFYASPATWSGARLAAWQAGWRAAQAEGDRDPKGVEAGADEREGVAA